ncbi:hypothetical protein COOONC_16442 [Cooperia oncophora]
MLLVWLRTPTISYVQELDDTAAYEHAHNPSLEAAEDDHYSTTLLLDREEEDYSPPHHNVSEELNALRSAITTLTKAVTDNQKRTHGETSFNEPEIKRNKTSVDEDILKTLEQKISNIERLNNSFTLFRTTNTLVTRQDHIPRRKKIDPTTLLLLPRIEEAQHPTVAHSAQTTTGHHSVHTIKRYPNAVRNVNAETGANAA